MSSRLLCAALVVLFLSRGDAAPPPWEAKKLKNRESYRSFIGVLAAGDLVDKALGKPCKIIPLKMAKGGLYLVELKSMDFAPVLRILSKGEEVAARRNAATKAEVALSFLAPRDENFDLIVSAADGNFGGYTLTVQPKGRPGDKGVTLIESDGGKTTFPLKASKNRTYALDLLALDAALRLELVDPKGKTVASSEGHEGDKRRGHVELNVEEDAVYEARVAGVGKVGKFLLRVAEAKGAMAPLVLDKGQVTVEEELTVEDKADTKRKTPCKIYPIAFEAGVRYTIDMESEAFDAFLRLEGPDGKEVAWDDDSGSGNNARINYVAKVDGRYRIIATCFSRGRLGEFTLKVREVRKAK
ncbi:MAG: PPC domain-containing protein [Gemmataceae bacterium]